MNGYYTNKFKVEFFEQECENGDMFAVISNNVDKDHVFKLDGEFARELLIGIMDYLDAVEDDVKKLGV